MNAKFLIPVIAGAFFTFAAQAHDCSGGTGGGMDATGNQCNDATVVATDNSPSATSPMARAPKAEASKAQSGSKSAAKRTIATRHAPARSQTKQG